MIQWLLDHFSGCPVTEDVVREAAKEGHLWILQLLDADQAHGGIQWGGKWAMKCLSDAAEGGHWDLVKWLYERIGRAGQQASNDELLKIAVFQNNLERVKWLVAEGIGGSTVSHEHCPKEHWATRVEILHFLLERGHGNTRHIAAVSVPHAARHGDLDTVRWLTSKCGELRIPEADDTEYVFDDALNEACKHAHLPVIQWILENVDLGQSHSPSYAMLSAAKFGRLEIVRWLWERYARNRTISLFIGRGIVAMDFASSNGHLEVVEFLDSIERESWEKHKRKRAKRHCLRGQYSCCTTAAMDGAATNGHLDVVKWLHANRSEGCTTAAIDDAAANGHLKVVQWLYLNRPEGATTDAMDNAAYRRFHLPSCSAKTKDCCLNKTPPSFYEEQLAILSCLNSNGPEGCTTKAMDGAAANGNLKVLKLLHGQRRRCITTKARDAAARWGHLDTVRWLDANRREGCTTDAIDDAAAQGHLKVVQWLHANRSEGCTTKAMNMAAANGHLVVVKWLLEHRAEVDIISAMEHAIVSMKLEVMWFLDAQRTDHSISLHQIRDRLRHHSLYQLT